MIRYNIIETKCLVMGGKAWMHTGTSGCRCVLQYDDMDCFVILNRSKVERSSNSISSLTYAGVLYLGSTSLVGTTTKLCSIRLIFFSKWSDASSICKSFLTGEIKALACWCFWNKISKYTELRPMAPCRYTVSKNVHIYFFKQSSKKRADFNLIIFGTEFWRNVT